MNPNICSKLISHLGILRSRRCARRRRGPTAAPCADAHWCPPLAAPKAADRRPDPAPNGAAAPAPFTTLPPVSPARSPWARAQKAPCTCRSPSRRGMPAATRRACSAGSGRPSASRLAAARPPSSRASLALSDRPGVSGRAARAARVSSAALQQPQAALAGGGAAAAPFIRSSCEGENRWIGWYFGAHRCEGEQNITGRGRRGQDGAAQKGAHVLLAAWQLGCFNEMKYLTLPSQALARRRSRGTEAANMAAASWPCGSPGRGLAAASRRRSPRPPRPCPRRVRAVRDAVVPLDREWDVRAWVRPRPPGPVRASPTPWTPGQCPARGCGWCTTETPYSEYLNPPTPTHTGRNRYVNVYRSQAKLRPTQLLPTDELCSSRRGELFYLVQVRSARRDPTSSAPPTA